jgi:hypothetical protein
LWRFLRAGRFDCDIYLGAPIAVTGDQSRKALARRAERAVRELGEQARNGGGRP